MVFEKTKTASISFSSGNIYHFGNDNFTGSKMYFKGDIEVSPLVMNGSESNPYLISSGTIWNSIKSNLATSNKYVTLINDITVGTSVPTLKATLDGNGHTITLENNNSLFENVDGGTVKNLTVTGNISSPTCINYRFGAVACNALNNAVIENCVNKATINCIQAIATQSFTTIVGGICAHVSSGCSVTNCHNEGVITSDARYTGGIVGYCNGVTAVSGCSNSNNINVSLILEDVINNSNSTFVGGLFGQLVISSSNGTPLVTNCHNSGSINIYNTSKNNLYCGGCFGQAVSSIDNCYNTGIINYNATAIGLCFFGGIAGCDGTSSTSTMKNCYNEGNIYTTSGVYAGGLLGKLNKMSIMNCYAYCDITATTAAGIVAYGKDMFVNTNITNCYYYGTMTATTKYGIAGESYSSSCRMSISYCYYPNNITNVCGNNSHAANSNPVTSATDEGMLSSLNSHRTGERSWVISGDHIVFGQ